MSAEHELPGNIPRKMRLVTNWAAGSEDDSWPDPEPAAPGQDGNIVTSQTGDDWDYHYPVIDLDFECHLVPSSTPGHHHLYIDRPITADQQWRLLDAMVEAGLVESGFAAASKRRGYTSVRAPWVQKGRPLDSSNKVV